MEDDPYGFPEHTPPAAATAQADGNAGTEQSGWPEHAADGEPPGTGNASIAEKKDDLLQARDMMMRQLDEVVRMLHERLNENFNSFAANIDQIKNNLETYVQSALQTVAQNEETAASIADKIQEFVDSVNRLVTQRRLG